MTLRALAGDWRSSLGLSLGCFLSIWVFCFHGCTLSPINSCSFPSIWVFCFHGCTLLLINSGKLLIYNLPPPSHSLPSPPSSHPSVSVSFLSVSLSICLYICLLAYLYIYLSLQLESHVSVCLSVCLYVYLWLTPAWHKADRGRLDEVRVQLGAIDCPDSDIKVVVWVGPQTHLLEDICDVILEQAVKAPRHLQRPSQNGEGTSKVAVTRLVAKIEFHVRTGADALLVLVWLLSFYRCMFVSHLFVSKRPDRNDQWS